MFVNQGCRLNHAETAVMQSQCEAVGHQVVSDVSDADTVVVNTCTVTENGDKDTRRLVKRLVRQNPQTHPRRRLRQSRRAPRRRRRASRGGGVIGGRSRRRVY